MTTIYNLRASNNATFQWTRDLSLFAAVYNLAAATIRMQARSSPYAPDPPAYEWATSNTAHGQILFNALTNLCVFAAPEGAACYAALKLLRERGVVRSDEKTVIFNTGTGLKYLEFYDRPESRSRQ